MSGRNTNRRAVITGGATSLDQVQQYMPANYHAEFEVLFFTVEERLGPEPYLVMTIEGYDDAGWTLDDYVIPRLASGLIGAREVDA